MGRFIWSKVEAEAGEGLTGIVRRKEAERAAGDGSFWWGIGNSLGPALHAAAAAEGGELPIVFSRMLSHPKQVDASPSEVWLWTHWADAQDVPHPIPQHVVVTSRGVFAKTTHYALVCQSERELAIHGTQPFNPTLCRTVGGKAPGPSQVSAVLTGEFAGHLGGAYSIDMVARVTFPYQAKLVAHQVLSDDERSELTNFGPYGSWVDLAERLRHNRDENGK